MRSKRIMDSVGILIQARLSSSRYPGKMLQLMNDIPLVEYVYKRCLLAKTASRVVVITSEELSDDELYNYCTNHNIQVFRGSLHDVLQRYLDAADFYNLDFIVRVCGDSPFVDYGAIDILVNMAISNDLDYCYLDSTGTFPGFISEVISRKTLKRVAGKASEPEDREHVTRYIRNHLSDFKVQSLSIQTPGFHEMMPKLTIDYPEDYDYINKLIKAKGFRIETTSAEIGDMVCNSFI